VVAPRSPEELRERAEVIHTMDLALNVTYQSHDAADGGAEMKGVDPIYKTGCSRTDDAIKADIRIAECITDAKGNRSLAPGRQTDPDAYVHVVDRRSDGVVIRGAAPHQRASLCTTAGDADQGDEAGRGGLRYHLRRASELPRRAHHQHDVPPEG
jgi:4-hydroxybutyryl-CoA dehydratase/vinylacetyl-CoA-Delta-isomerase